MSSQDKETSGRMNKDIRLVGLTGTNGAGKGEVAAYLTKKGYAYFSLSDVIRDELKQKGEDITRNSLIKMGNYLRQTYGADVLARRVMEKVEGKAVIDSIRNPMEVRYLKQQKNFVLLAVDAPVEVRFQRVQARGRVESAATLEEFIAKEREEMGEDESGQQLQACIRMADIQVINDGSLESLHKKLEEYV